MFSQMSQFMSSDNDSRKTSCIFDNGDRVDFLKTFINDTCSTDVCESCSSAITFAITAFTTTHVQSRKSGKYFVEVFEPVFFHYTISHMYSILFIVAHYHQPVH